MASIEFDRVRNTITVMLSAEEPTSWMHEHIGNNCVVDLKQVGVDDDGYPVPEAVRITIDKVNMETVMLSFRDDRQSNPVFNFELITPL